MATKDSFDVAAPDPATIGPVEIVLTVTAGTPNTYAARYSFDQKDASGAIVEVREGNLIPHLTNPQKTSIQAFLDQMLTKAQASV